MIQLPALSLAKSTRSTYIFSQLLLLAFFITTIGIIFAPWRQFVTGTGKVIAFDPLERRVNVEALVSGRVKSLKVVEGQRVQAGELIAEIQDNDPNLLENLREQKLIVTERIALAKSRVEAYESQIEQKKLAKAQALDAAKQAIADSQVSYETEELNYTRVTNLHKQGYESKRAQEQATMKRDSTLAKYRSAQAKLRQTENDYQGSIDSTRASLESAKSSVASAESDLAKMASSVSKNERQIVTAPRDGIILSVSVTDGSYLKPGTQICVIIPETDSRFVEAWVDGNDVALIKPRTETADGEIIPGSEVRLAFEGWPAVQTIGWPQTAVGTFGGEVRFIDATDDGSGRFRVVIGPSEDPEKNKDKPWPDKKKWLRQGTQTKAWVLLDEVPLWFELWRQINGFPPIGRGLDTEKEKSKK